jgi:hypothetical protein
MNDNGSVREMTKWPTQIFTVFTAVVLTSCSGEPVGPGRPLVRLTGMLAVTHLGISSSGYGPTYVLWNKDFTIAVPLLGAIRDDDDQLLISVVGSWADSTSPMSDDNFGSGRVFEASHYDVKSRVHYHDFLVPAASNCARQLYGCSVPWNKTFGWDEGSGAPVIQVRMTDTFSSETPRPYIQFEFDAMNGGFLEVSDNLEGRDPCDL